jgi:hypothetical protein
MRHGNSRAVSHAGPAGRRAGGPGPGRRPGVWKKADGRLTKGKLLKRIGTAAGPVREVPLHEFFAGLTAGQAWHGDRERAAADRYRNLLEVIRTRLSDVRVFKVGGPRVDVYVLGTTDEGDWAGLKTGAVET